MAKVVVLYTDTDAIRSVIGLDVNDVSDDIITGQKMEVWMALELAKINPDYENAADSDDTYAARASIWCQLWGALKLITLGPLAIPQRFQANQDQMHRFANIDWASLEKNLRDQLGSLTDELKPTLPSAATYTVAGVSSRGYDPITGV